MVDDFAPRRVTTQRKVYALGDVQTQKVNVFQIYLQNYELLLGCGGGLC